MDPTREHLWGQLLLERNLLGHEDLVRLAQERDHYLRSGQDASLAQLLAHHRVVDPQTLGYLQQEVEVRGRACFNCRQAYLAAPNEPAQCRTCGGPCALPQPGAYPTGAYPSQSGRYPVPAQTGAYVAPGTGHYPRPQTGHYPHPGSSGAIPAASGRYAAPYMTPPPSSQAIPAAPGSSYRGGPAPSEGVAPSLASVRMTAAAAPRSTPAGEEEFDLSSSADISVGKRFGIYEIQGELGRGGMGVVYKVRDPRNGAFLALKVLLAGEFASPKLLQRFRDEAQLASNLRHPNIVAVHDVGEVDGIPYYAMDYIEGSELSDLIKNKNLPVRRGAEILIDVARAAHHAHEHGIIHRDLKPANVLVDPQGKPYIMDFGLAKNLEEDKGLTRSGVAIGTPYYMPPEQARGSHREMDARSDVYALGAILYEILCKRVPFTAKTQNELLRKIIEEEPEPPRQVRPGVPPPLEVVALKALSKDKVERYESALAMAEDLARYLAGDAVLARPPSLLARVIKKARKNKRATMIGGGVGLLLLVVLGAALKLSLDYRERLRIEHENSERELAEQAERERLQAEERRKLDDARAQSDDEIRKGLQALRAVSGAASADQARAARLSALERFDSAMALEAALPDGPRPGTSYQRGLLLRDLCRWEPALTDLEAAAKDPAFKARAQLARGVILLRFYNDRAGAIQALGEARASGNDEDAREERGAEALAQAYLALARDDVEGARRKVVSVIETGGLVTLAADAQGALAYVACRAGDALGGDDMLARGLPPSELAYQADRNRYEVVVDRALLLARNNDREPALRAVHDARSLWGDGIEPDLVEAVLAAKQGDTEAMRSAFEAARRKAREQRPALVDAVLFQEARIEQALRSGGGNRPPVRPNTPRPSPSPSQGARQPGPAPANLITSDYQSIISFNPNRLATSAPIQVGSDVLAIRISVNDFPGRGVIVLRSDPQGSFNENSVGVSRFSMVLRRDSDPPIRPGNYTLTVQHLEPTLTGEVSGMLTVKFYRQGDALPYEWKTLSNVQITLVRDDSVQKGPAIKEQADRILRTFGSGQRDAALTQWAELERRDGVDPRAALMRANWLVQLDRHQEGLELARSVLKQFADEPLGLFISAQAFQGLKRYPDALKALTRLVQTMPELREAHQLRMDILEETGDWRAMAEAARDVIKLDAEDLVAGATVEAAALRGGDKGAQDRLVRLMTASNSVEVCKIGTDAILASGDPSAIPPVIEALLQRRKGQIPLEFMFVRARAIAKAGDLPGAIRQLEELRTQVTATAARIEVQKVIDELQAAGGKR